MRPISRFHVFLLLLVCIVAWTQGACECLPPQSEPFAEISSETGTESSIVPDGSSSQEESKSPDSSGRPDSPLPLDEGQGDQTQVDRQTTPDQREGAEQAPPDERPVDRGTQPEKPVIPEQTTPTKCKGNPNAGGAGAVLPNIPAKEYVIELSRWGIKNNGTQATETTDNLQKAIDWAVAQGYGRIKIPAGTYLIGKKSSNIYSGGIVLKSNMALLLDPKAVLQMVPNDTWNYSMIAIRGQKHVAVIGGTLRGDRDKHTFAGGGAHDEGHGIEIKASQYVLVENLKITNMTGDGVLIVGQGSTTKVSAQDVTIRGCELFNNRRQGVSIVGGIDILIEKNEIHHIKGTSPEFGIDIESLSFTSKDIIVRDNYFHHNAGGDIVNTDGHNVLFEKNKLEEGEGNRNLGGPIVFWNRADMTIRNNTLYVRKGSVNGKVGILGYSNKKPKTNTYTTCIHDNVCDGCGFYIYNTENFEVRDNEFLDGYICMQYIKNIVLVGNKVTHSSKVWAYRFKVVTGSAKDNLYNGQPFSIPLSSQPYTGAWID